MFSNLTLNEYIVHNFGLCCHSRKDIWICEDINIDPDGL